MIVYRSSQVERPTADLFAALKNGARALRHACPAHASAVSFLIDLGMFEAGVVDAVTTARDDVHPIAAALRRVSVAAGHVVSATWRRLDARAAVENVAATLAVIRPEELPRSIQYSVPEGYAYYGLFPEQYLEAAERFAAEVRPDRIVCIGLRSIGSSLSAVVSAALESAGVTVESWTVRPRGHPWDRRLDVGGMLDREWRRRLDWQFAIIDEGPGISGSSFSCTAEALSRIGVPDDRIALFPSWIPNGESFSHAVAQRWRSHSKWSASFEDVWLESGRLVGSDVGPPLDDVSAGRWREVLFPGVSDLPAVHAHHERRKFIAPCASGRQVLLKFSGLGRFGRAALERAERMADAGWGPRVLGLHNGFLAMPVAAGSPVSLGQVDAELLGAMAEYLAMIARSFPADDGVPYGDTVHMIETNVREGMGDPPLSSLMRRLDGHRVAVQQTTPTAIDGRMFPHEWLRTSSRYVKTDGVDHHRDHFWPGCVDIAWDLAAVLIEFGLDAEGERYFLDRYMEVSRDTALDGRLSFYKVAYLSHRLGYSSLAARTAPDAVDRRRFAKLERRYVARLSSELAIR